MRSAAAQQDHHHQFGPVPEDDRHRTLFAVSLSNGSDRTALVASLAYQVERDRSDTFPAFDYSHAVPGLFAQVEQQITSPKCWLNRPRPYSTPSMFRSTRRWLSASNRLRWQSWPVQSKAGIPSAAPATSVGSSTSRPVSTCALAQAFVEADRSRRRSRRGGLRDRDCHGGLGFLPDKKFSLSGFRGAYGGATTGAMTIAAVVSERVTGGAGVAKGFTTGGRTGARVGFTVGF